MKRSWKAWRRCPGWLPAAVVALIVGQPVGADLIPNGGFETGTLAGWTVGGTGQVQVVQAGNFVPAVAPPEGQWMAALSSGPGDTGGVATSLDWNDTAEFDVATLSTTFTAVSAPVNLSMRLAFMTSEFDQPAVFDDLFDVTLNGFHLLRRSVPKSDGSRFSPWPDTGPLNGISYTMFGGVLGGSVLASGRTDFQEWCFTIANPGTYTLQFRVADQGDREFDTVLLVDDVAAPSQCSATLVQVSDTADAVIQVKDGAIVFTAVESRDVALNARGDVMAFVSDGNVTGDNPNARQQIFVDGPGGLERLTSATQGIMGRPALSANGRWVAFASTADLTGGNPDGNPEIFRTDRATGVIVQVTDTAGCENRSPSIAGDGAGDRIAFVTTCTQVGAFANPDGNEEVVLWDGAGFSGVATAGCRNFAPAISRATGRYVAMISTCNHTGGNPNGVWEIVRWDTVAGAMQQITSSPVSAFNDTPDISAAGDGIAFISNADHTGGNADGSFEVFLWRPPAAVTQLTSHPDGLPRYFVARLSDDGAWVAAERLDFDTFTLEVVTLDTATGTVAPLTGDAWLPDVAVDGGLPVTAFQSWGDFQGTNPDGNLEVWRASPGVAPGIFQCASPNLTIPDNNAAGVTSTINVASAGEVAELAVAVVITHPRVGDLVVQVTSPAGVTRTFLNRPGLPGQHPVFGCRRPNVNVVLDDSALENANDQCTTGVAINGTFRPVQPLSDFQGQPAGGAWTIRVSDLRNGQVGTFNSWCLLMATQ